MLQKQKLADDAILYVEMPTLFMNFFLRFEVPENLKFGSFDSLIKLVDDLVKYDSQVETVLRRVERQIFYLDAMAELSITTQRAQFSVEEYIAKFRWDDIKYPRARSVQDNIQMLLTGVQKIDEEVKSKGQQYSDAKQQASSLTRKEQVSHVQRDLVDLLTPDSVSVDDFVYSEHLTTLVVVVPRGADHEFVAQYSKFDEYIVPDSAKRVAADDKEGNSLWRVVMFKSAVDAFRTSARQHRYTVRDFAYDCHKYKEVLEARQASEVELKKQEGIVRRVCHAAFSDALVAWVHLKAIRTFVESVLRFGVPPNFGAYLIRPISSKQGKLRAELTEAFSSNGMFGQAFSETKGESSTGATDEEGGEYFPYVYLPFTLQTSRGL